MPHDNDNKSSNAAILVICPKCGGEPRNHAVVCEHSEDFRDDEAGIAWWNTYQIVKCLGCDSVRFRQYDTCTESIDDDGSLEEYDVKVFPTALKQKRNAMDLAQLPNNVSKMYSETVNCFNSGSNTLSGGGLRATVEALCADRGVKGHTLEDRINALVTQGHLAKGQADHLHQERFLGNDALHEMSTPSDQDLIDGLEIIEGLLKTVYVLPIHAKRLENRRTKSI